MNQLFEDETLLARWLSGELDEAERRALEAHPDFPAFKRLVDAADRLALPDADEAGMWNRFSQRIENQEKKRSPMRASYLRVAAAAAVLAGLLFAALFLLRPGAEQAELAQTAGGEQKILTLPDGSTVRLNAASSVEIFKENWDKKRRIRLNGEALFSVQKNPAAPFVVETPRGTVEVLGTVFTVKSRSTVFEVSCYSGKVRTVNESSETRILQAGESTAVRYGARSWSTRVPTAVTDTLPPWTGGNSRFDNAPLPEVVSELETQYGVTVDASGLENRRFSGAFPHNNLDVALKIVCGALDLKFTVTGKKVVIRNSE